MVWDFWSSVGINVNKNQPTGLGGELDSVKAFSSITPKYSNWHSTPLTQTYHLSGPLGHRVHIYKCHKHIHTHTRNIGNNLHLYFGLNQWVQKHSGLAGWPWQIFTKALSTSRKGIIEIASPNWAEIETKWSESADICRSEHSLPGRAAGVYKPGWWCHLCGRPPMQVDTAILTQEKKPQRSMEEHEVTSAPQPTRTSPSRPLSLYFPFLARYKQLRKPLHRS